MLAEVFIAFATLMPSDTTVDPEQRRDPMQAARTTRAIAIDGRVDEEAWQASTPIGDFVQRFPDWGASATERTEVRVLYDAEALYVSVRAHTSRPGTIVAPLTRRDDTGGGDRISVFIDSWHDRRTGFAFTLSAAGVRSDAYMYDDSEFDDSWDATWQGATTRDAGGWTAEFRIPFSQLRFTGGSEEITFGFNVARTVAERSEVDLWQPVPQDGSQFVSRFGELEGLRGLRKGRRIELLPYVTGRQRLGGSTTLNPFDVGNAGSATAGLDLRGGIGSSLTLTAAFNPDFGQLDGDPATVNLSPNETFFEERRPFFTEASDAFRMPIGSGGQEGLVYSRRIGRAPQLTADPRGGFSQGPDETTILGAAKLTGKTRGGWNVALLAARTAEERAAVVSGDGVGFADVVEPGTLYGAGRIGRDLRGGRTVVSGMATLVHRSLTATTAPRLRSDALAIGTDLAHRWGPGDRYRLRSSFSFSRVGGSAEAIAATQRSPLRYFQRPDNQAASFDPTRTSLTGTSALLEVEKRTGDWRWLLGGLVRTPGFELNDLGYLRGADHTLGRARVSRRWSRLGALSNTQVAVEYRFWGTSRLERNNHGFVTNGTTTLGNGWSLENNTWLRFGGMDPQALRGGPSMAESGNIFSNLSLSTDRSRQLFLTTRAGRWHWFDNSVDGLRMESTVTWRPAARAELGLGVAYNRERWAPQLLGSAELLGQREYLVSDVSQKTLSTTIRAGLTFSPTLTLQLWAEPFTSAASYLDPRRVVAPRATTAAARYAPVDVTRDGVFLEADLDRDGTTDLRLREPDFTTTSIRSNLVLRWEYRPSSTLFLVWQHDRSNDQLGGQFRPSAAFGELFNQPGRNQLAVKFSYWWNVR
jgi:hypothetical protein